jgi:hypothetical protein
VFTHPELPGEVEQRFAAIVAAIDKLAVREASSSDGWK